MADGFLGRWSRRKQEVREGRPLQEPASAPEQAPIPAPPAPQVVVASPTPGVTNAAADPQAAAPTLDDVRALTTQSDFKPFMARDVAPEVKNAAMKKLFADPHFNVMDGLDIYIDDYSKPDPLPLSMMRKMASAQFLNLFDDEKTEPAKQAVRDNAVPSATPVVEAGAPDPGHGPADRQHRSEPVPTAGPQKTTSQDHAHTDLRLQQDHAAGPESPGRGAG